jgi:hypothetical protein
MPAFAIIDAKVNDQRSGVCDPYDATVLVEVGPELSEPHLVHQIVLDAIEQGDREVTVYSSASKGAIWIDTPPTQSVEGRIMRGLDPIHPAIRRSHCVVCGEPTTSGRRWCSRSCMAADGEHYD